MNTDEEVKIMTQYREILMLNSLDLSERSITASAGVSRNTVNKVLKRARELHISWPLNHDMTDSVLEEMLFPKDNKTSKQKHLPDFDYIRCICQPKIRSIAH